MKIILKSIIILIYQSYFYIKILFKDIKCNVHEKGHFEERLKKILLPCEFIMF